MKELANSITQASESSKRMCLRTWNWAMETLIYTDLVIGFASASKESLIRR